MPISNNVTLGKGVVIPQPNPVNLYGCSIGEESKIGSFVEIQKNATVGRCCKISSHSFICEGVTIEDEVFIGHGVIFINDRYPKATKNGSLQGEDDWEVVSTVVRKGASIGSGVQVMCGITVGTESLVGAGTVVVRDVPDYAVVAGNPGEIIGDSRHVKVARK